MINQTTKPKARQERPALKVMHRIDTDENGKNPVMSSKVLEAAPKLKEAVDSAKLPKIQKPSTVGIEKDPKPKREVKVPDKLSDEERSVLKALEALGGKDKDIHSPDIAVKLGFDKEYPTSFRGHVRKAMEALHALHLVTSKKEGAKYSFRITERGVEYLANPPKHQGKDKHDPDDVPDHMLNEAARAKAKAKGGDPL